ncbi:hypothetical protein A0256_11040 [Mucilaginibacter sp. PAMC 26640]|nr:hypothetical protein A0256_11040 [Mucilaginibacter sp. PAMC 26640]
MDVGYYISELLGHHGTVNVQGLGYFAHTRVNGYYNDAEGKFYPPGYSVQFDPQSLQDDDALAVYIADKKKISVASSKYFTEKFVLNLKQQAVTAETALADLGWFSTNTNGQLIFRPNNVTGTDPEFFGYPAISLHKIGQQPQQPQYPAEVENSTGELAGQITVPVADSRQQAYSDEFQTEQEHEDYLVALTSKKRRTTRLVVLCLVILFTAAAIVLVQRYNPSAFGFFNAPQEKPVAQPKIVIDTSDRVNKKDTADAPLIRDTAADTLSVKTTPVADSTFRPRFELIDGAFKTEAQVTAAIIRFKAKGIDAKRVADPGTGPLIKVSIGTYATRGEAEDALKAKLASKVADAKAKIIEINPQNTGIKP